MGLRFRKSINLGGARINISKKGIGASVGVQGARITKTADGKTRKTIGVPGTGISYTTESRGKKKANAPQKQSTAQNSQQQSNAGRKAFATFMKVFGIIIIVLSLLLWLVLLPVGICFTLFGVGLLLIARRTKKGIKGQEENSEEADLGQE